MSVLNQCANFCQISLNKNKRRHRLVLNNVIVAILLCCCIIPGVSGQRSQATFVDLGAAKLFAIHGSSAVNANGAASFITGSVGVAPGTSITGFGPSEVLSPGVINDNDATAIVAQADKLTAYNNAAGQICNVTFASELTNAVVTPGVYCSASGTFTLSSGSLTFDGQGSNSSVFLFQAATTLITSTTTQIILINEADADNIFWVVGTGATLASFSSFIGNILAGTQITIGSSTTLLGRALAQTAVVLESSNAVTLPAKSVNSNL